MDRPVDRKRTQGLIAGGGLVLAVGILACGCGLRRDERRIPVDGRRVHLESAGHGRPVVVLEAGLGGSVDSWSEVLPPIAGYTRVVAYDRAGLGGSSPGPTPRTASRLVEELGAALAASGEPGPYVLVGHSFGGAIVRLFAFRHPEKVAGLVLVDATHEDFPSREALLRASAGRRRIDSVVLLEREAVRAEWEVMDQSLEELRVADRMPDVPIVVLTAGRFDGAPSVATLWLDFQNDLAGRFPGAVHHVAEKSGHAIPFEDPEAVVRAVREVVDAVRAGRKLSAAASSPAPDPP